MKKEYLGYMYGAGLVMTVAPVAALVAQLLTMEFELTWLFWIGAIVFTVGLATQLLIANHGLERKETQ